MYHDGKMEELLGDTRFDKALVFLTNNIRSLAEEWFKICGWFLLCSTLRFISDNEAKNSHIPLIFLYITFAVGALYFLLHYQKIWYIFAGRHIANKDWHKLLKALIWGAGVFIVLQFSFWLIGSLGIFLLDYYEIVRLLT